MSQLKSWGVLLIAAVLVACGSDKQTEYSDEQQKAIAERIAPAGSLAMEGDPIASAPVVVASAGPRSGEDIYKKSCFACHATGAAGAPKLGDAAAWADRIAQGMAVLNEHAWNGFKTMPAKGNCFDCTEEEMQAAVKYIVDSSQ